ncbi:MAG: hypothetical protein ACI87O_001072 [Planctomycetota bacterium]
MDVLAYALDFVWGKRGRAATGGKSVGSVSRVDAVEYQGKKMGAFRGFEWSAPSRWTVQASPKWTSMPDTLLATVGAHIGARRISISP